jgi:hypothetical protein
VLNALFQAFEARSLLAFPQFNDMGLASLLSYSDRHLVRADNLLQAAQLLDFVCSSFNETEEFD